MATLPITIRSKQLKRFLFVGPTGAGKSKIINCCYNRRIDRKSLSGPADVGEVARLLGKTSSISNYVDQHERKVYVDTVGYGDARFNTDMEAFILFFRELICYTSIGYNWLFLVLRFERLTQDILIYIETLEQLLGEGALTRCTIIFTHCQIKDMDRAKCIKANQDSERIINMLTKAHSVIFGNMDTLEDDNSDDETRALVNRSKSNRCQRFMKQILEQVDATDDNVLTLDESWLRSYWSRLTQYLGYWTERIFGISTELSKRYRLSAALANEIPVVIYYESCPICLELMIEIWNTEPKACVTKCGHIFHYSCLKKWFNEKKECPCCRANLQSLPGRVLGQRIGLHAINDGLKVPSATAAVPSATAAVPSRAPESSSTAPSATAVVPSATAVVPSTAPSATAVVPSTAPEGSSTAPSIAPTQPNMSLSEEAEELLSVEELT